MKHFIDPSTNQLFAFEDDVDESLIAGSLESITAEQADQHRHASEFAGLTVEDYRFAIQEHMDAKAREAGYDDIGAAVTYADEPAVPKFQGEGKAFRAWRSRCWAFGYEQLAMVEAGSRPRPTIDAFIAELPPVDLPQQ